MNSDAHAPAARLRHNAQKRARYHEDRRTKAQMRLLKSQQRFGTVYFVQCPHTKLVKIGFTTGSVVVRLAKLQTGSPTLLSVAVEFANESMALETAMHRLCRDLRHHGEWFAEAAIERCVTAMAKHRAA